MLMKQHILQEEINKPYSYGPLWLHVYQENFKIIKKFCKGVEGKRVLEVGCGGGWLLEWLEKERATVYGLDIASDFCKVAKLRSKLKGLNYEVICGDGENIPFRNGTFDMVIFYAVLHHFPDFKAGLNEALRVASRIILADEPCQIPLLNFLIINTLRNKIFKRAEYSGIEGHRFCVERLNRSFLDKGYAVTFTRIWSYVPSSIERKNLAFIVYKIAYKLLMLLFKPIGHAFIMVIDRK